MQRERGGQSPGPPETEVKAVVVGDGGCGKTSLLVAFARGDFPKDGEQDLSLSEGTDGTREMYGGGNSYGDPRTSVWTPESHRDIHEVYVPTVFEKYTASLQVAGKPVTIHLWDTAGQEDYDRLRPLSYSDASVVLMCFDVTDPNSFDNILTKWYPEVNHFCKGVPVLLVGCKTDLRQDETTLRKLRDGRMAPVSRQQGEAMARQVRAVSYMECSARYQENVVNIFVAASSAAMSATRRRQHGRRARRGCVLL